MTREPATAYVPLLAAAVMVVAGALFVLGRLAHLE